MKFLRMLISAGVHLCGRTDAPAADAPAKSRPSGEKEAKIRRRAYRRRRAAKAAGRRNHGK